MHEGLPGEDVLLLLSGIVKATYVTRSGREVILAFRGAGELIGELSMIDERPHSSTPRTRSARVAFRLLELAATHGEPTDRGRALAA
jgi:CRP/FNR family transcriptional regulator, cyclic AMP receptor protein